MPNPNALNGGRKVKSAEREQWAVDLRVKGHSFQQIGTELGISKVAARKAVMRRLAKLAHETPSDVEARALELERLDREISRQHEIATQAFKAWEASQGETKRTEITINPATQQPESLKTVSEESPGDSRFLAIAQKSSDTIGRLLNQRSQLQGLLHTPVPQGGDTNVFNILSIVSGAGEPRIGDIGAVAQELAGYFREGEGIPEADGPGPRALPASHDLGGVADAALRAQRTGGAANGASGCDTPRDGDKSL